MCETFLEALIGVSSQFSPSTAKCASPLFIDTPEKGGMRSLRRDMSAAWMYPGSMLLITPQSFQELAIDRLPFSFSFFCLVRSLPPPYH